MLDLHNESDSASGHAAKTWPNALEVENLTVAYDTKTVFRNLCTTFPENRISVIVGPSGCGKSTLLSCINRISDLIPSCRVTGVIRLDGKNVLSHEYCVHALRKRIGTIFQRPTPFPMSIRRNITVPLREHGAARADAQRILEAVLKEAGLWEEVHDRLDKPALTLSGGQQQRLCIARALALEPQIMLFDEPCTGLDPISAAKIESLILSMKKRKTVILVTHNISQARRIADQMLVCCASGQECCIIESGPAESIFQSPQREFTQAYLRLHQHGE